jgi:hypothetical protein
MAMLGVLLTEATGYTAGQLKISAFGAKEAFMPGSRLFKPLKKSDLNGTDEPRAEGLLCAKLQS